MLATKSVEVVDGIVELDETFVGGKNKNRPRHKKVKQSQGRSFKDKTPVMGVLQREEAHIIERPNKVEPHKVVREKVVTRESKIQCQVVPNTKAKSLQPIITSAVKAGTIVVSDEWYAYRGLHARYQHHTVDHGKGQYADADGYNTNTIEGAWSQLKRTIIGTYHQVSRKHLQKYVDEFTFRYNTRKVTVDEILDHAMVNVNSRLTYKDLVGKTIQKVVAKEHN
jgi:transposase-like protein